ncbi:MAG: YdcF family protein [bacterium]|nr:YdcF family protein [bacterium]
MNRQKPLSKSKGEEYMLFWMFNLIAVLCMAYYIVILLYSGIGTSWSFVWLFGAVLFLLLAVGSEYYAKNSRRIPLWVPVSVLTTLLAGVVIFAVTEVLIFSQAVGKKADGMDYVIVLGTQVKGESISDSLKKRLDEVLLYAEKNPDTIFVLSGGKGKGEYLPEAEAMYTYLKYNGVEETSMIKEEFSTNTKQNLEYSKRLIEQREAGLHQQRRGQAPKIAVLSSDFHVFRAKQLAKKMGLTDIYGISAPTNKLLFVHFCVREALAVWKDKLLGNM